MIQLHNLTPLQKELCDKIWSLDTQEDIMDWINTLPPTIKFEAYVMMQMMIQAVLDESDLGTMKEANEVINRIRYQRG